MTPGEKPNPMPPYRVLHDFLPPAELGELLDWTLQNSDDFRPASLDAGEVDPTRRHSLQVDKFGPSKEVLRERILAAAPDLIRDLGVAPFEISKLEMELVAHKAGAFYIRHIDTFTGPGFSISEARVISTVFYFHRKPKGFTGGNLRLYRFGGGSGEADYVDIAPEHNTLLAFPSWASHEVRRVEGDSLEFSDARFAVNAWICRAPVE